MGLPPFLMNSKLKMYILVRDTVPLGFAINSVAHASLMGWLQWQKDLTVQSWLKDSFKKVTCKVPAARWEEAKAYADYMIVTEGALGGQETALVFKPRFDWPPFFKSLELYK